jgi:DNA-binding GntR family transcriptional regulator
MSARDVSAFTSTFARSAWPNSLVGKIAEWVACAIIEGQLKPGDDLNSVELSKQFGASRASAREALLVLEGEGLVEIVTNRRPRVKPISIVQIRDMYEVRSALYGLVAERIVTTAADDEIASLRTVLGTIAQAVSRRDIDTYFWANVAFRKRETEICGNAEVKRMLDSLGLRSLQVRHMSISPADLEHALNDRELLVRAYEARNAPLAVALARTAVDDAFKRIEKLMAVDATQSLARTGGRPSRDHENR